VTSAFRATTLTPGELAIRGVSTAADQIKAAMEKDRLTKAVMSIRLQTSRRALDRLLDATNTSGYSAPAAARRLAVGRQLRIELI
jgi:hypothetical protein